MKRLGFTPKGFIPISELLECVCQPKSLLLVYKTSFLQGILLTFIIFSIIHLFPQRKQSGETQVIWVLSLPGGTMSFRENK